MTRSVWQARHDTRASPTLPAEADVVVAGAGITGAATAWALAEAVPGLRVVVLDRAHAAAGASGRNAGFLLLGTHADYASAVDALGRDAARALWRLTRENLGLARRLGETADVGLSCRGSVLAAGLPGEADRLRRSRTLLAEDGVDAEWIEPEEVSRRVGVAGYDGALWVREGGTVDPVRLVGAALAASGATVVGDAEVARAEPLAGGVRVRLADGRSIRAGHLALALNAWLPAVVPALARHVRPVRAQMLATAPLPPALAAPVYSHDGYVYLRQHADGRLLAGGARHLHVDEEVGYDDAVTGALQADLEAFLARHVPAAAGAAVVQRWSGTMGFSPDGLPVVGDVPGVPGAVYAAGFTGHGMGFGLRVGRLVASRVLGRPDAAERWLGADRVARARRLREVGPPESDAPGRA